MSEDVRQTEIEVEVRYAETDQMGVVHHSNYLVWFELARTRLCRDSGFHYADIERLGYLLMVTGCQLRYSRSARYGDHVGIRCWVSRLTSRTLHFAYEVHRDDEVLATGGTDHVWIDQASGRPCRIPESVRPAFEALGQSGQGRRPQG